MTVVIVNPRYNPRAIPDIPMVCTANVLLISDHTRLDQEHSCPDSLVAPTKPKVSL